jgi:hypothetical protein
MTEALDTTLLGYNPDWTRICICGGYPSVFCLDHPRAWSTGYIHIHQIVAEIKIGRVKYGGSSLEVKQFIFTALWAG